jgi:hypothetical protein
MGTCAGSTVASAGCQWRLDLPSSSETDPAGWPTLPFFGASSCGPTSDERERERVQSYRWHGMPVLPWQSLLVAPDRDAAASCSCFCRRCCWRRGREVCRCRTVRLAYVQAAAARRPVRAHLWLLPELHVARCRRPLLLLQQLLSWSCCCDRSSPQSLCGPTGRNTIAEFSRVYFTCL